MSLDFHHIDFNLRIRLICFQVKVLFRCPDTVHGVVKCFRYRRITFPMHLSPALSIHQLPPLEHRRRLKIFQILKQNKVRQLSRPNHPPVIQVHPSGRRIGCAVDCLFHRHPILDRMAHYPV